MAAKQWYQIEIECMKYQASSTMLVGEKNIVAKVKSEGLAYKVASGADSRTILATSLQEIYKTEYFKITIK